MEEKIDLLANLNDAQKEAVTHTDGPLLIVAGAGTGKTTVLTRRYVHLLQHAGVKTENILALTFTEKAAGEMEDRVIQLLPTGAYDFWISTFHAFAQRVLELHGLEIGLPNQFRLLTETDAWLLLKRHLEQLPLDYYRPLGNPNKYLRALLSHISRAKDEGIDPIRYHQFIQDGILDGDSEFIHEEKKRLQELAGSYAFYRKLLLEQGALDFGDLILEVLRLLRERPRVLELFRKQFRYIMVDEFQDTNWAQYELIKLLAGTEQNITVVGDDDQAIYKFRGASLANILQFQDDFPKTKTVALTQNYRSKREILDIAYTFICRNNPNRLEVKLAHTGLSKQLQAEAGEGGSIEVLWKSTVEDEAQSVIQKIARLRREQAELRWNDFAILVRSNDGAEPFVRACERAGIPFQFFALRGLYSKPIIVDLIAFLSLLDGYHESSSVWRVMTWPSYGFTSQDIAELLQYSHRRGIGLWQALQFGEQGLPDCPMRPEAREAARMLIQHVMKISESAKRELPLTVFQLCLHETGYLAHLMKQSEREKVEQLEWLQSFAQRIRRYEQTTHAPSLRGFLVEFKEELESGEEGALHADPESGPEQVSIMTVHASKGLEFKHVFIVSLVDQRFPTRQRGEAIPLPDGLVQERLPEGNVHLEEERRLFYVALTRAKESLTLSGATDYGGSHAKKPSSFFADAGLDVSTQAIPKPVLLEQETVDVVERVHQPLHLYDLKKRFSFTQLAAFRKCPLQYKFAHIYRIPILGSHQKTFGQSVHLAFQRILEAAKQRLDMQQGSLFDIPAVTGSAFPLTEEEAITIYNACWIDEWYKSREQHDEYFEQGKKAVRHFWKACTEEPPKVLEVEKPFTLVWGKHSIIGKIDRVDQGKDGVIVFDYKTGRAKDKLDTEDKEQLYLYQLALEERGIKVEKMQYVYVLDWVTREVELLSGEKREEFVESMMTRMEHILTSEYGATPEPFTCKYCDFQAICEFKKL